LEEVRLTPAQTVAYLRQTDIALDEIHAHGICHRDLKPENLMIRSLGIPGEELVLIDFSIAIVKDPDETLHNLSRAWEPSITWLRSRPSAIQIPLPISTAWPKF
jgi:serine/threonine protein kinase